MKRMKIAEKREYLSKKICHEEKKEEKVKKEEKRKRREKERKKQKRKRGKREKRGNSKNVNKAQLKVHGPRYSPRLENHIENTDRKII